mmetsp:Transcript_99923/g.213966  ORF Transcript_99923/g.213966 Transcript_99923/m.213966 type:complete len:371 (+) Transcript_99923:40-1152(+)
MQISILVALLAPVLGYKDHRAGARHASGRSDDAVCNAFQLTDKMGSVIPLNPRAVPARVIDTFAFGDARECEELLLHMMEMGNAVDEIHIVEGDRDFTGARKDFLFDKVWSDSNFDPWREKTTYHKVSIPPGLMAYDLQNFQRNSMHEDMNMPEGYNPKDILLEGDLDEIVSSHALKALRHCEPGSGAWNTDIQMDLYYYSMAWTKGKWKISTAAVFVQELSSRSFLEANEKDSLMSSQVSAHGQIWSRPNVLGLKDGNPSGWHVGWTLDGAAGLAHKIFIHVEGRPTWAQGYTDEASLAKFLETSFLPDPHRYDLEIWPSSLTEEDVPRALLEHPEKFPNIMRGVNIHKPSSSFLSTQGSVRVRRTTHT